MDLDIEMDDAAHQEPLMEELSRADDILVRTSLCLELLSRPSPTSLLTTDWRFSNMMSQRN